MSTDYTHLSKISFDQLFARKGPNQEVQIMDSDGNLSGINNISSTGTLSVTSIATTAGITAGTTIQATGNVTGANLSGTNTGDVTVVAVGAVPSANGASLSGQVLTLQPADGTHPGLLTSGAQTIGGAKTFNGAITASNLSGSNTGDQTITLSSDVTGSGTGAITTTVTSVGGSTSTLIHSAELAANAATNLNTVSTIVKRDGSGNFTAGTVTAALTGNASTATTLQTARNINGTSFNGSADITVTAAAGTLTGSALNSTVTGSSLTSVGTLANLTVTNPIAGSVTGNAAGLSATLSPASGGTGVANNAASTLAISGNFGTTLTVSGVTTATLQPTTGVIVGRTTTDTLTNKTLTTPTISQPVINGFTDASSAGAGVVGQLLTGTNSAGSVLTSNTGLAVTSISLTAGDWDLWGIVAFSQSTSLTSTDWLGSISTTTGSGFGNSYDGSRVDSPTGPTAAADAILDVGPFPVNISSTTTYFLNARGVFSAGTAAVRGTLYARRRR